MYQFNYHKPATLDEAQALFNEVEDGMYLAGGQTLIPTLKQRLAAPTDVIDLAGVSLLTGIAAGIGREPGDHEQAWLRRLELGAAVVQHHGCTVDGETECFDGDIVDRTHLDRHQVTDLYQRWCQDDRDDRRFGIRRDRQCVGLVSR